jgi:hypothetical protein
MIGAWGSPSGTLSEIDLDSGCNLVAYYNGSDCNPNTADDDYSIEEYPVILDNNHWDLNVEAHRVNMTGHHGHESRNLSSRYPMIGRLETSDVATSNRLVQNQNPNFEVVLLQTLMESIRFMVKDGSPLAPLVQQGDEIIGRIGAVALVATHAEQSTGNATSKRRDSTRV